MESSVETQHDGGQQAPPLDLFEVEFNRNPVVPGRTVTPLSEAAIKATPGLWHASLDDAMRYGGDSVRHVLAHMDFVGNRRHIVVDVKVHMLLPGFLPAIPGWHTDGVPRWDGANWNANAGLPSMRKQQVSTDGAPRYHLYVSGHGCLTRFLDEPLTLEVPDSHSDLYADVSRQVNQLDVASRVYPGRVITWDWWNLHTAQRAAQREWRLLVRATETDWITPESDLRSVLRTQEQVYVPEEFGW